MAVTLAQAKLNVQDALQMGVIDEFAKSSFLLNNITFDECVSPTGGGATLDYSYSRLITQPTATARAVNTEYTNQEVSKERISTEIKIFGGKFAIDRVIADMGGIVSEVTLQMEQKIKAASTLFSQLAFIGDAGTSPLEFSGLDTMLAGSSTEATTSIDLSTSALITSNYQEFLDELDSFLMLLDGTPSMIAGNTHLISKLRAVARRASMYQTTKDDWGRQVEYYGNVPFVDLGAKVGTNDYIIPTDSTAGTTDLYAVRLGLDGFHGITVPGQLIKTWLPDYSTEGAVKMGEVEMLAAAVLKRTKAAGVLRGIKVS